mgnify:FL=1
MITKAGPQIGHSLDTSRHIYFINECLNLMALPRGFEPIYADLSGVSHT